LGYGAVVKYGLDRARGTYCIFVAADGVDPINLLQKFLDKARNGANLVQCSRFMNLGDDKTIPFTYKFYQFMYRSLVNLLLGRYLKDSTYAFKLFERRQILDIGVSSNRFNISPEITFKFMLSGRRIEYIAAGQGTRKRGKSHFSFRKEGFGYAYVLLRAWLHRIGITSWF
jgi:dolichol-phosphate mannosyltransferase